MSRCRIIKPVREKVALFTKESPFVLRWIREKKRNSHWFHLHWHPEIECHVITGGTGKYIINGKAYPISRNSLVVIHPRCIHKFIPPKYGYERISLLLKPEWLGKQSRLGMVPHHLKIVPGEMSQIVGLFQEVQKELEMQRPLWTELVKTKLLEYFILMRRAALGPALPVLADNPLMNQLLAYLDGNYMRPLSLSQLSGHFGFSAFYLSHCFSRFTGIGIKRYILQRRIAEAQLIMEKQSNLKLTAVARQIGFKDYAVFNRAFFKIVHVSPSAYRK